MSLEIDVPVLMHAPRSVRVERIQDETPSIRSFWFSDATLHHARPGQFAMVWVPGVDEVPMSVLAIHGHSEAGLVIKKGGPVSVALWDKKPGDKLWVRGPYGQPYTVGHHHRLLIVGGGTGLVPLISLLVHLRGREITLITGARTASELLFKDWLIRESKEHNFKLLFATDDGSYGEKNQVPKVVEHVLKADKFDAIYTCGPEPMMKLVYDLARLKQCHMQVSLERVFKCGLGICAACVIGPYLVCRDGPVFSERELSGMREFGHERRDLSGKKVPLGAGH
ncbi:dihydroorotate dehydrogenase electron transfer subunit [Candidatus Bathyarchaeota archaeon]|nr:MAG: dihydroorotate dehydrogenase electron transfer subunit [Candidatus Bathyarchaeota archaeon]